MEREEALVGERRERPSRGSMVARVLPFAFVAVTLVVLLHLYIGSRLIDGAGLTGAPRIAAWGVLWLLFLSVPGGFAASRLLPRRLAAPVYWVSHFWFGLFGLLVTAVAATDVLRVVARWMMGSAQGPLLGHVQALAILAVVIPSAVYGFFVARGAAKVERVRVPLANVGPALDGLRVVQLSDLHIGETLGREFLERVVDQVNALEPDVVAITGDLVDGSPDMLRDDLASLRRLRARDGVFYVTGNHEYYHGGGAVWEAEVRRFGITPLHNEHVVIQRGGEQLVVAGIPDREAASFGTFERPDVARALTGAPAGAPRLLLAHQPRQAREAAGKVDLQLSGHTHGGQIFPFMYFVRLQQPAVRGLAKLHGHWVYTHRGTGYWGPPLRIGPAPEIAELVLTSASPERK